MGNAVNREMAISHMNTMNYEQTLSFCNKYSEINFDDDIWRILLKTRIYRFDHQIDNNFMSPEPLKPQSSRFSRRSLKSFQIPRQNQESKRQSLMLPMIEDNKDQKSIYLKIINFYYENLGKISGGEDPRLLIILLWILDNRYYGLYGEICHQYPKIEENENSHLWGAIYWKRIGTYPLYQYESYIDSYFRAIEGKDILVQKFNHQSNQNTERPKFFDQAMIEFMGYRHYDVMMSNYLLGMTDERFNQILSPYYSDSRLTDEDFGYEKIHFQNYFNLFQTLHGINKINMKRIDYTKILIANVRDYQAFEYLFQIGINPLLSQNDRENFYSCLEKVKGEINQYQYDHIISILHHYSSVDD